MRLSTLCLSVILLTTGCASAPKASLEARTLGFWCDDVVVVARLENGTFTPVKSEDDILGHGWISATLKVRKVVRGASVPSTLPVKYFAHTYLREDRDLMLGLTRTRDGDYKITTSQVMWFPILAKHCGQKSPKGMATPQ
jgi:hypothetical protein